MNTTSVGTIPGYEDSNVKQQKNIIFTKFRIIKNLVIVSIGSFLSFCAYDGLSILQSTINRKDGIGVLSVSIQYGLGCVAALLFTKYYIKKFGCKSVIAVTSISYVTYIAANFYPVWFLMIPSSVLVGLANSLFWGAQGVYLNGLSALYVNHLLQCEKEAPSEDKNNKKGLCNAGKECEQPENNQNNIQNDKFSMKNPDFHLKEVDYKSSTSFKTSELYISDPDSKERAVQKLGAENETSNFSIATSLKMKTMEELHKVTGITTDSTSEILESTTARMFGFHGLIFQNCHIWSNLMSYYVLKSESFDNHYMNNATCMCGAEFCNLETDCFIHNLQEPGHDKRLTLLGIFVSLSMLSVFIIILFLDELETKQEKVFLSLEVVLASFRQMKNKFQILLIPITLQVGVAMGFFMGDYTKAYIGCAWGVQHVGLVTVSWGAALAVSCTLSGWFVKHLGRIPIFLAGEAAILSAGFLLLTVYPDAERKSMFFIISVLIGFSVGIIWSQGRAFYGIIFKGNEEAAFGNYQIFHSMGASLVFGCSNYLCTSLKVYILIASSVIATAGYLLAEICYPRRLSKK